MSLVFGLNAPKSFESAMSSVYPQSLWHVACQVVAASQRLILRGFLSLASQICSYPPQLDPIIIHELCFLTEFIHPMRMRMRRRKHVVDSLLFYFLFYFLFFSSTRKCSTCKKGSIEEKSCSSFTNPQEYALSSLFKFQSYTQIKNK